jgi:transcription elongation factor Elf1
MTTHINGGKRDEKKIVNRVACPNCNKELLLLPPGYPPYDIQCSGCSFRAQVKTNQCKPKNEVFGAGWDIIGKVLKSGFIVPPLFVSFKWRVANEENQAISFFPFVPKTHLKKYELSQGAQNAGSKRFNYVGLLELPHFISFRKGRAAESYV